jgi:hypothetical protein
MPAKPIHGEDKRGQLSETAILDFIISKRVLTLHGNNGKY